VSASGAEERSSSLRGGAKQAQAPPKGGFCFQVHRTANHLQADKGYNSCVTSKSFSIFIILALCCTGCGIQVREIGATTPTFTIITATLPSTLTPLPSQTLLPALPSPTSTPVEGSASTQINVRSEPSTVSEVLGIISVNTKIQIVGKDPGENWWQILYPQGADGKGWVTAQYVTTAGKPDVPVIGGGGANPNNGNTAIIQQKLNIRSGPGTDFNSIGMLNPQDVVNITGKDVNGAWLQIEFAAGPKGKGWVNAAFVQAQDVDKLPIVTDAGQVVGTGTPVDTPLPPTPTVVPAPMDNDSAEAPAIDIVFSATGTSSIQYTGDVSSPIGDTDDWLQFTPFTQTVQIDLTCTGDRLLTIDILQDNQIAPGNITCDANQVIATNIGTAYLIHIHANVSDKLNYTRYMITINSIQ
jgi:uncharacterized protein YraI